MSDLLFIRHAETDLAGTFCGHTDPPVNERGHAQIALLTQQLQALRAENTEHIRAVYSSDLQRALTTAAAIARSFNLQAIARPGLREIHFGAWEGLTWKEVEAREPALARSWAEQYPSLTLPGAEVYAAFEERVLNEVTYLHGLPGAGPLAVVTHAGVMRVVLRRLCGLSEQEAWAGTRSYCCFFRLPSRATR
jgi:broad specificity phosphatase PhoE